MSAAMVGNGFEATVIITKARLDAFEKIEAQSSLDEFAKHAGELQICVSKKWATRPMPHEEAIIAEENGLGSRITGAMQQDWCRWFAEADANRRYTIAEAILEARARRIKEPTPAE